MSKNNLKIIIAAVLVIFICISGLLLCKKLKNDSEIRKNTKISSEEAVQQNSDAKKIKKAKEKSVNKKDDNTAENNLLIKKDVSSNLFNDVPSSALPLSAIAEISKLPANIQNTILKITESNNIYMLQRHADKLFLITDNNENIRHNVDFVKISIANGHQIRTTLGYNDKIKDSDNDIWEYNEETKQPIRHTKYNSDGDVEFVEIWNYGDDNPIKYEMKDAHDKVISMRKETLNGGTDLRVEHLVYDEKGNTVVNISTTYEGQDLKRFTYYNADDIKDSGSIFSDYSDGQKIKEVVYTSDLKVKNTYTSEYKDGEREEITKLDNNNKEVEKYIQIDTL